MDKRPSKGRIGALIWGLVMRKIIILSVGLMALLGAGVAMAQQQDQDPDGTLRFHMTQNGRQMTANDFDEWMAKKGLRVVGGQVVWNQGAVQSYSGQPAGPADGSLSVILPGSGGATTPIPTAPTVQKVQYDSGGQLLGYDSGWSEGSVVRTSAPAATRQGGATITSYDSGRDY